MSSKHFINDADLLVSKSLRSLCRTNPLLDIDGQNNIVFLQSTPTPQVALISGGGSGHEPSFGGLVGPGLLSAAVAGSIFSSPSTKQVWECISRRVDAKQGVLVIVMNYTGDALHFGIAVEKAKASGIDVRMLMVGDDVGVGRSRNGRVGRRGIAGTVLVQKVAGAAAAAGLCLKDVYAVAKIASENLVSVGASLAHVHVPGRSHSSDELDQSSDIEVGMGIHNEEGFGKMQADLVAVVKTMLAQLLDTSDKDRGFIHIRAADPVILLVNNLGGVSPLELGAIVDEIWLQLDCDYSLQPMRILTGTFMTSLNGLGFSISILKLADTGLGAGKSLLDLIDAPAEVTGWAAAVRPYSWLQSRVKKSTAQKTIRGNESTDGADGAHGTVSSNLRLDPQLAERVLRSGLQRVIDGEPEITRFDTIVGDGDCGTGIKRGATAVLNYLSQPTPADAVRLVSDLCHVVESNMDGTSGAIYSIFLNALTGALASQDVGSHTITMVDAQMWARALSAALESLGKYTPARPGDRTLVDALDPFVRAMEAVGDFKEAATAAEKGSESTQGMEASLGRSVYVGGEAFKTCPDPGAYALSLLLLGMSQAV